MGQEGESDRLGEGRVMGMKREEGTLEREERQELENDCYG